MALKNTWTDKSNNKDVVDAAHINEVAHAVIELEEHGTGGGGAHTSAFSAADSPWDETSLSKYCFYFKAFRYSLQQENLHGYYAVRFKVVSTDGTQSAWFRVLCDITRPFTNDDQPNTRMMIVPSRVYFENEDLKGSVDYYRSFEKNLEGGTEREMWFRIKLASGYVIEQAHLNVIPLSDGFSDMVLEPRPFETYTIEDDCADLDFKSASWSNWTSVINIGSRATAWYGTASGVNGWANGYASDVGGIENTINGQAGLLRGNGNTDDGDNNIGGGAGNTGRGSNGLRVGTKNVVDGDSDLVGGQGNTLSEEADFCVVGGYGNNVQSPGWGVFGNNHIVPAGIKQGIVAGARLMPGKNYQAQFGVWSERAEDGTALDKTSMMVVANGSSSKPANICTVNPTFGGSAAGQYYAKAVKPSDVVTLGYFLAELKAQIAQEVLASVKMTTPTLDFNTGASLYVKNNAAVAATINISFDGEVVKTITLGGGKYTTVGLDTIAPSGYEDGLHYAVTAVASSSGYLDSHTATLDVYHDELDGWQEA